MIRCIQVGRSTIQGHVTATWPDPAGEHGAILSMGRVVMGRLIPQERYADAVDGLTEHERLIKAPWVNEPRRTFSPSVEVCPLCDIAGCRHIREAGQWMT